MGLSARLTRLEASATRRKRQRVAEAVAELEGVSPEEAFEWTEVDPDDQAAALQRFGNGLVDVGELARWMAARHGLTAQETSEAVSWAERCNAQLEGRAVAEPWR